MADGVAITAGSGTTILTDDTGAGGHAQVVKLGISTDGSGTLIPADATNGIDVDVTRLPSLVAGTAYVGKVSLTDGTNDTTLSTAFADAESNTQNALTTEAYLMGYNGSTWDRVRADTSGIWANQRKNVLRVQSAVSGVTTATTAYTAGDQVGTMVSLANAARATGGTGRIASVMLQDRSDIVGAYDVAFFRANVTLAGDNAAFAISDTDSLELVGLVQLAGGFDIGNNRICQAYNLSIPYDTGSGTTLYAVLLCRVGHTFFVSGSEPYLTVYLERD